MVRRAPSTRLFPYTTLFRSRDVGVDEVGNVVGWAGGGAADVAPVVLAAHLDTVFGPDVNVAVERRGPRLEGPGISDKDRKSTRVNSSDVAISLAVCGWEKKK